LSPLRQDAQLVYWREVIDFLGFDASEQRQCTKRIWQNSLFGSLSRFRNRHIRSGDVAQWKREFSGELAAAFLDRFPNVLRSLNYEADNRWIEQLRSREPEASPGKLRQVLDSLWLPALGQLRAASVLKRG
jgi:hypothetical protein